MVKHCYTLLVAGTAERQKGIANLWKQGEGPGRTSYPDFGKCADQKLFECFVSAAPHMFCDEKHWHAEKEAATWEIFRPVLDGLDVKRAAIFKGTMSLLLDESMSGWRPQASKYGGLPNYTCEVGNSWRNPVAS